MATLHASPGLSDPTIRPLTYFLSVLPPVHTLNLNNKCFSLWPMVYASISVLHGDGCFSGYNFQVPL